MAKDLDVVLASMENSGDCNFEDVREALKEGPIEHTFGKGNEYNSMKNWIKFVIDSAEKDVFAMFGAAEMPVMSDEDICRRIVTKAREGINFILISDKWAPAEDHCGFVTNSFVEITCKRDSFPLFQNLHFGIRYGYPSAPHVYAADNSIAVVESLHKFHEMPHHVTVYSTNSSPEMKGLIQRRKSYMGFRNIRLGVEILHYLLVEDLSHVDLGPEYNALLKSKGHRLSLKDPGAWVKKAVSEELGKTVEDMYNEEGERKDIDHSDVLEAMFGKVCDKLKKQHKGHYIAWYRGMILNKAESIDELEQTMQGHYRNYPYIIANCGVPVDRTPIEFDGVDLHPE